MNTNGNATALVRAIEKLTEFVDTLKPAPPDPNGTFDDEPVLAGSNKEKFLMLDRNVYALVTVLGQKFIEPVEHVLRNDWIGNPVTPPKRLGHTKLRISSSGKIDISEWLTRLDSLC